MSPLPLFASVRRVRGGKSPPIASPSATTSTAGVSEGSLPSAARRHSDYAFPGPGTGTATGGATTPTPTSDASPASSNDAAARGRSASAHARTSLVATLQRMSSRDRPRRGCVWGWGALPNSYGSPPLVSAAPAFGVAPGYGVAQMAVGGEHVLFLLESGDVYTLDVRTPALTPTPEAGGGGSGGGGVTAAAAAAGGRVLTAADVTALKAAAEVLYPPVCRCRPVLSRRRYSHPPFCVYSGSPSGCNPLVSTRPYGTPQSPTLLVVELIVLHFLVQCVFVCCVVLLKPHFASRRPSPLSMHFHPPRLRPRRGLHLGLWPRWSLGPRRHHLTARATCCCQAAWSRGGAGRLLRRRAHCGHHRYPPTLQPLVCDVWLRLTCPNPSHSIWHPVHLGAWPQWAPWPQ